MTPIIFEDASSYEHAIAEAKVKAVEDTMAAFFTRFTAYGSISVPVIKTWWHDHLKELRGL